MEGYLGNLLFPNGTGYDKKKHKNVIARLQLNSAYLRLVQWIRFVAFFSKFNCRLVLLHYKVDRRLTALDRLFELRPGTIFRMKQEGKAEVLQCAFVVFALVV